MINLVQELEFETDSIDYLRRMARLACDLVLKRVRGDCYQLHYTTQLRMPMLESDYLYVCSLNNYKEDLKKDPNSIPFKSFDKAIDKVAESLRGVSIEDYHKTLGDGFTEGFNSSDGCVDMGFRMSLGKTVFPTLDFWVCHIYYGK